MTEGALTLSRSSNSTALAVVVLMHGAAITALALSKMEVIPPLFRPTVMIDFKDPPTPPPVPDQPRPESKPQQSVVTHVKPLVDADPQPFEALDADPLPPQQSQTADSRPLPPEPQPLPPTPPTAIKVQPARAKANLATYVSNDDYPASAQRDGQQGTSYFKLGVDPNGRVSSCTITQSSGSSALDAATCRLMKQRARFNPAHDDLGRPVGDIVVNKIRWVLPDA